MSEHFVLICFLSFCVVYVSTGRFIINSACSPPRGEICIEIRQCPYFADILARTTIPRPKSVIKVIREHQCGFLGNTPKVCCDLPSPSTTPRPVMDESTFPSVFDRFKNDKISTHRNFGLLPNDICGPIMTDSRITSGTKTVLGEFPWMALLAHYTSEGLDFRCGGTVINNRYVLTAAHCILNSTIVGVRLGEYNVNTPEDCDPDSHYCAPPVQDFYIEKLSIHPEYNPKSYVNDIALIRLATPANFSYANVQPICLPTGEMMDQDLTRKYTIVSGWGITEDGYKSNELLKVSLPVVPISECQKIYDRFAPITDKQICAGGYKGRDSCGGDSGGPMKYVGIINASPRYIQFGIVSYGPRHCGTEGQPGVYTRVSNYIKWILDELVPSDD